MSKSVSPALQSLMLTIRQHPAFEEFKAVVKKPTVQPFRVTEADKVETARARWIFESGKLEQHRTWLFFLTGEPQETS